MSYLAGKKTEKQQSNKKGGGVRESTRRGLAGGRIFEGGKTKVKVVFKDGAEITRRGTLAE